MLSFTYLQKKNIHLICEHHILSKLFIYFALHNFSTIVKIQFLIPWPLYFNREHPILSKSLKITIIRIKVRDFIFIFFFVFILLLLLLLLFSFFFLYYYLSFSPIIGSSSVMSMIIMHASMREIWYEIYAWI